MKLEETITVGGEQISLLKVNSFRYRDKMYCLFIDPDSVDEDGSPIPYLLERTADCYVPAKSDVVEETIPYISDILAGTDHFSFDNDEFGPYITEIHNGKVK